VTGAPLLTRKKNLTAVLISHGKRSNSPSLSTVDEPNNFSRSGFGLCVASRWDIRDTNLFGYLPFVNSSYDAHQQDITGQSRKITKVRVGVVWRWEENGAGRRRRVREGGRSQPRLFPYGGVGGLLLF